MNRRAGLPRGLPNGRRLFVIRSPAALPPVPAPEEPIELDSDLLQPDPDPEALDAIAAGAVVDDDAIPAGLGWHINRLWARVRPVARPAVWALAAAFAMTRRMTAAAAARVVPAIRRAWLALQQRRARRNLPPEAGRLSSSLRPRRNTGRLSTLLRGRWHSWPASWRRLTVLAAGAFAVGGAVTLPFALAGRGAARPPVAVERVQPLAPKAPPVSPPVLAEEQPAVEAPSDQVADDTSPGTLARRMAREAFEAGRPVDGVAFFRMAVRSQRRAADDDLLILYTAAAVKDRRAGAEAERLLAELARDLLPAGAPRTGERALRSRSAKRAPSDSSLFPRGQQ
jgi:hypothetical protein